MRSSEIASSDAQVSSRRRCSGPASRAGRRGSIASTPRMRIGAFSGRYRHGAAGQRVGAEAGRLAVVEGPLRDARIDRPPAAAGAARGCRTRSCGVGDQQRGPGVELATAGSARAISATCSGISARRQVARHLVQRRACAARAAWRHSACTFRPAVSWPITSATDQHHGEGQQVLHVADARTRSAAARRRSRTRRRSRNAASTDGPRP